MPAPIPPLNIAPVDYTFFKVNPNCVNPLFAVAVDDTIDTDNFLCTTFFDAKVVRNLDVDGRLTSPLLLTIKFLYYGFFI